MSMQNDRATERIWQMADRFPPGCTVTVVQGSCGWHDVGHRGRTSMITFHFATIERGVLVLACEEGRDMAGETMHFVYVLTRSCGAAWVYGYDVRGMRRPG